MKQYIFVAVVVIAALAIIYLYPKTTYIVYDCSIAEFHPDIPIRVKEACREQRALELKNTI